MNKKKLVNYAGKVLMILAFALIVWKLYGYRDSLAECLNVKTAVVMLVCAIPYGCLIYTLPMIYKELLQITTGKKFTHRKIAGIYCKSALYKYLPGNVMQYVGRNQLAVTDNLSHFDVAAATMLDISTTVFACVAATVVFSFRYAVEYINAGKTGFSLEKIGIILGAAIATFVILCVVAFIWKREALKRHFNRYLHLITLKNIVLYLELVLYNILVFVLFGLLFMWVLDTVGGHLEWKYWPAAIGLYCFSYLLGYITPGVPGGIGIREAVLGFFFAGWLSPGTIITGALVYRVATIIGDVVAYFISVAMLRIPEKKKETNVTDK
ncbi:MAG: hypothetical protein K6G65_02930 [Lachnospiraceae bacterium]|nr:hypothetical protein [Lachnospiraceae bacterium]